MAKAIKQADKYITQNLAWPLIHANVTSFKPIYYPIYLTIIPPTITNPPLEYQSHPLASPDVGDV